MPRSSLSVNGEPYTGAFSKTVTGEELLDNPIVIANTGKDADPGGGDHGRGTAQPLPAGGDGFAIERTYYRLDGSEANVTEVDAERAFRRRAEGDARTTAGPRACWSTTCCRPASRSTIRGLVSSADLANFGWLARTEAAHLEFRDDRFIAAFDREPGGPRHHARLCGARGDAGRLRRIRPPSVEDMYRPQYSARTATGMMEVKAP